MIIYTDMCADLCHYGHYFYINKMYCKIKKLYPNETIEILVGIHSDKTIESYKRKPIMNMEERMISILQHKYVARVIGNAPLTIDQKYLNMHNIKYVFTAKRPDDEIKMMYNFDRSKLIIIPYTEGISTTDLIDRIKFPKYTNLKKSYLYHYGDKLANKLIKYIPINIHPNFLTLIGFTFGIISSISFHNNLYRISGISLIPYAIFDLLDGAQAKRWIKKKIKRSGHQYQGWWLDHMLDYFLGISFYYNLKFRYTFLIVFTYFFYKQTYIRIHNDTILGDLEFLVICFIWLAIFNGYGAKSFFSNPIIHCINLFLVLYILYIEYVKFKRTKFIFHILLPTLLYLIYCKIYLINPIIIFLIPIFVLTRIPIFSIIVSSILLHNPSPTYLFSSFISLILYFSFLLKF